MATIHHLTHPHELSLRGEVRFLAHRGNYEACGCLIVNVENLGHRAGCRNIPIVYGAAADGKGQQR